MAATMNSNSSNDHENEALGDQSCENVASLDRCASLGDDDDDDEECFLSISNSIPPRQIRTSSPSSDDENYMISTNIANKTIHSKLDIQTSDTELKRKKRNSREKKRSCHIAHQIHDLKCLLRSGGINTCASESKASILEKTAKYIEFLQKSQYEAEMDRQQIFTQLRDIRTATGNGLLEIQSQVSSIETISHFSFQTNDVIKRPMAIPRGAAIILDMSRSDYLEYRLIIQACSTGIVISSLGGDLIECNERFCDVAKCTKQQICSLTIFDLITQEELDGAYDQLNMMLNQAMQFDTSHSLIIQSLILRGGAKVNNMDLEVVLVKGDDGRNKFFCLTIQHCDERP